MVIQDRKARKRISALYGINKESLEGDNKLLSAKCENGTFIGREKNGVITYRGIPYAKSPVGNLRWKRPVPPAKDDRVFEAFYNGPSPIQSQWPTETASYYHQSEDCLYLNIWTASKNIDKKSAVMVFFHGGAYGWGGTIDPLYDGYNFIERHKDIVLVTVGYRTGLLGFVDFSMLPGGEEYPDAPNLGILDQIESLRWVKKNISAFGGDPDSVTIFGESAGGGTVSLLPIIDEAKGLFKRVIAESGSVALTFSKKECANFTRKLVEASGFFSVKDLAALSEKEIMAINEKVNNYNNFPQRDGKLIPIDPYAAYASGMTKDIDMIMGTNANEMNYWIGELGGIVAYRFGMPVKFENDLTTFSREDRARANHFIKKQKGYTLWRITEFYNEMMFRLPAIRQIELHEKNGGKGYMYYWNIPSTIFLRKACHAVELAYVFNNVEETIYTGEPADKATAEMVGDMWVQFAKTGSPEIEGLSWPEYSDKRETLIIEKKPQVGLVLEEQRKLLYPLLKYIINASSNNIVFDVPFVKKAVLKTSILVIAATLILMASEDDL